MSRGLDQEAAVALIVNGFAREVLKQLPMEFAVEAQKLLGISLEGSVGMISTQFGVPDTLWKSGADARTIDC